MICYTSLVLIVSGTDTFQRKRTQNRPKYDASRKYITTTSSF